ncbi:helix-turn-helix domain-containing protein [Natronomonas amylolytica]|uniref:helix-turn-helix domain-containing protein n=1 Tax=Natronomonas amylolytica TaxID=3108498 RepID=UPI00300AA843
MKERRPVDVNEVSPEAWRLLRVAAGYDQRDVERAVDGMRQAHVSMLESGTRALSADRRKRLLELYTEELTDEQIEALIEHF